MARTRILHPGFFQNEVLAELSPLARLLFAGLWTLADREGRLEDRPRRIKAALLPWDDCDAHDLLASLHAREFIDRYEVDGEAYIQIRKFDKYQKPHLRETESLIPKAQPRQCQGMPKANLGSAKALPRQPVSVSVSVSDPVPTSVCDDDARAGEPPVWTPTVTAPRPQQHGRLFLHRWQLDKLLDVLGPHAEHFGLDAWLDALNTRLADHALPRDVWRLVRDELDAEIAARGLTVAQATRAAPARSRWAGWSDECAAQHASACGSASIHETRKAIDAARAAREVPA